MIAFSSQQINAKGIVGPVPIDRMSNCPKAIRPMLIKCLIKRHNLLAFEVFLFIGYLIEGRNKTNCLKIFCLISNTRKNLDQFKSGKCKLKCGISERIQFNEFQILANKSKV